MNALTPMEVLKERHLNENLEILRRRTELLHALTEPCVGDWVIFNDCNRRISHIWKYDENAEVKPVDDWGIQTSQPHSSYYLGEGYVSYSGSLYMSIKGAALQPTGEMKPARVWFFDRDWMRANGGVHFETPFKVWKVDANAPEV